MAYIGKTPVIGNFVKLDSITVVNGQAAYTMQNGGVNFTSYDNVNQFLVSLNGVLQAPTDSFTVSGSTLTFASNLSTGDVIDFVLVLGNSLDIGTPSDNTVSLAKLTATGTKDSTTFLRGDNTFAVPTDNGKILQVVNASTTTETVHSTSTYTDTGITASITPSSTSSKILVNVCATGVGKANSNTWTQLKLLRGSTDLIIFERRGGYDGGTGANKIGACATTYQDSPATTSATTYKVQMMSGNNSNYAQVGDSASVSTITLMEIAG